MALALGSVKQSKFLWGATPCGEVGVALEGPALRHQKQSANDYLTCPQMMENLRDPLDAQETPAPACDQQEAAFDRMFRRAAAHMTAELLIQGDYLASDNAGCSLGCHLMDIVGGDLSDALSQIEDVHGIVSDHYGIPQWVVHFQEGVFECLSWSDASEWHVNFAATLRDNSSPDWSKIKVKINKILLDEIKDASPPALRKRSASLLTYLEAALSGQDGEGPLLKGIWDARVEISEAEMRTRSASIRLSLAEARLWIESVEAMNPSGLPSSQLWGKPDGGLRLHRLIFLLSSRKRHGGSNGREILAKKIARNFRAIVAESQL